MSWKKQGNCYKIGVDIFFSRVTSANGKLAISLCNSCPVKKQCNDYIKKEENKNALHIGIWAGLGPNERLLKNG